ELSRENTLAAETIEKRLKRVLERLVSAHEELALQPWWLEMRQRLRVWTNQQTLADARAVYAPDDGFAVEVFEGSVPIAWNPLQAHRFWPFIKSLGCRSLATATQATLIAYSGASVSAPSAILTPAAKELIVLMVCNAANWRECLPLLEAL